MRKSLWVDLVCGLLILLFLYTALSKLLQFHQFRDTLQASPLIASYSGTIAWVLPVTEILVSLLLFIPATKRTGLYASLVLLLVFTLYLVYMLLFTQNRPCSCGGVIGQMNWRQHVFFNLFFIGLSVAGLQLHRKHPNGWNGPIPYPSKKDVL